MPNEKKAFMKKLLSTENLALIVSIIALVVAWLPYRRDIQTPILHAVGKSSHELTTADEADPPYAKAQLLSIELSNEGQRPAHNVRLSLFPALDPDPLISLSPAKMFTKYVDSGVLVLTLPVLGMGEHVILKINSKLSKEQSKRLIINEYPCFIYVDSDEGASTTSMAPLVSTFQVLTGTSGVEMQDIKTFKID